MAGKKQQAPKPTEEDEEVEGEAWDNAADVDVESPDQAAGRMRDWRDVEKYREMRELRRLVGDDFNFSDVLGEIPVRSAQAQTRRGEAPKARPATAPPPPKPKAAPVAVKPKPVPAPQHKPAPKPAAAKQAAHPHHKPAKKAAKPAKPAPKHKPHAKKR